MDILIVKNGNFMKNNGCIAVQVAQSLGRKKKAKTGLKKSVLQKKGQTKKWVK